MVAKLTIDKVIGQNDPFFAMMGMDDVFFSASDMQKFIEENSEATDFEITIRSDGGSVREGFDIYDQLIASGKNITTIGYRVNSIATVIFLAGQTRKVSKNAQIVAHNPWVSPMDIASWKLTAEDAAALAEEMQREEDRIKNFYAERLGLDDAKKEELYALMAEDKDMGAEKALYFGFATEIMDVSSAVVQDKKSIANMVMALSINANFKTKIEMDFKAQFDALKNSIAEMAGKINALMPKVKNEQVTLADGAIVYWQGELEEGTMLYKDEAMENPVDDTDHVLEDGTVITTLAGKVTKIVEPDMDMEALKAEVAALTNAKAALETENANLKSQLAGLGTAVTDLQNKVVEFGKMVPSAPAGTQNSNTPVWKKRVERHKEITQK